MSPKGEALEPAILLLLALRQNSHLMVVWRITTGRLEVFCEGIKT